jgi:hypothetical protein
MLLAATNTSTASKPTPTLTIHLAILHLWHHPPAVVIADEGTVTPKRGGELGNLKLYF